VKSKTTARSLPPFGRRVACLKHFAQIIVLSG
jgi:hypothetical protein